MALSFSELRKNRKTSLAAINTQLDKLNTSFKKDDDRFWQPTVDKAGNGYAVIRFLDAPEGEDAPFVRVFDHGFKGPTGKWYIELSRTTMGEDDPVSDMNSKLWEQGENSAGRKTVSGDNANGQPGTKRRTAFYSNILVIEDPDVPENNGKVFLFKYGKKIFDKLNDAMNPKFKDETQLNPFDLWEGANFKLKIRKFEGQRNYDKSEFDKTTVGPAGGKNENELETLWKSQHSLAAFLAPDKFKTYEDLQKKLNQVMDINGTPATRAAREEPKREQAPEPKSEAPKEQVKADAAAPGPAEDDDESLEFFKKLT
jgi:hypothetical protein